VRACVLQEKGTLAGGTYATTGKTSARSDLSPVFGESLIFFFLSDFPGFICLGLLRESHVRGYHKNSKSENFAKFSGKLKFLTPKKFNRTSVESLDLTNLIIKCKVSTSIVYISI